MKAELDEKTAELVCESYDELVKIISEITDRELLNDFFSCLFSETEKFDFGKRWLLVKKIKQGKTQREIARDFKMSLCKITRGSRELKKENSAFKQVLDMFDNGDFR